MTDGQLKNVDVLRRLLAAIDADGCGLAWAPVQEARLYLDGDASTQRYWGPDAMDLVQAIKQRFKAEHCPLPTY
jgi:hypothetical protein